MKDRWMESLRSEEGEYISTELVLDWIEERRSNVSIDIDLVPLTSLADWKFDESSGSIRHKTGRFFDIVGLSVSGFHGRPSAWDQPIIRQAEIGILGCLVSEINGILHFLVQAKIEPGNVNGVQLSPTLQATRSNITRQHGGRAPKYLNYFTERSLGKVIFDQLQTEQGSRFLGKRNRNIIVECLEQPSHDPDFLWLTLGQLKQLARLDNVLNMDLRTVISSIPIDLECLRSPLGERRIRKGEQSGNIVSSDTTLMSWLVQLRSESLYVSRIVGLNEMQGWTFSDCGIFHRSQNFFDVVFSQVTISNREVATWGQPIIRPRLHGLICFFVTEYNGEIFFLVQAKSECGGFEKVELTSTLCFAPGKSGSDLDDPHFYDLFLSLQEDSFLIDTLQSEEGGRFYREQNRNCIVDVSKHFNFEDPLPAHFKWFSHTQLMKLIMHSNYLSIQARSLLAIVR